MIKSFKEFFESQLQESANRSFARHFAKFSNPNQQIAILTAFRQYDNQGNKISFEQNVAANENLKSVLQSKGYGFTPVIGSYPEVNTQTGKPQQANEISFVISPIQPISDVQFEKDILQFLHLNDENPQDSAVVKFGGTSNVVLLYKEGKIEHIGKWQPNANAEYYTQLILGKGRANIGSLFKDSPQPDDKETPRKFAFQ